MSEFLARRLSESRHGAGPAGLTSRGRDSGSGAAARTLRLLGQSQFGELFVAYIGWKPVAQFLEQRGVGMRWIGIAQLLEPG